MTTDNHASNAATAEEGSPLLSPTSTSFWETRSDPSSSAENAAALAATPSQQQEHNSKGTLHLAYLTLPLIGLQIAWCVELSHGSPYLLSLAISKSLLALVWIAGPLSGTLVQPYVGMKSDRCRSRFGRRRVFMVGGAVATLVSLIVLAWAKEIVGVIASIIFGSDAVEIGHASGNVVRDMTIVVAVVMIYVLDFAINVVQAAIRAFIVDGVPTHQQDTANAWASRMSGLGIVIGYLFGYVDLPRYFGFLGHTQFQVLCILASLMLGSTLAISCLNITEQDSQLNNPPSKQHTSILTFFQDLYRATLSLPRQVKAVCLVQIFAWIGWFPALFYITTYIGELYVQPIFSANPNMSQAEIDAVWERATRIGTFALFMYAITTFIASVILPFFVGKSSCKRKLERMEASSTPLAESSPRTRQASAMRNFPLRPNSKTKAPRTLPNFLQSNLNTLTLRRAWLLSHILFAVLMWATFLIHTPTGATILVSLVGIPWAITSWAPFAIIAEAISAHESDREYQQAGIVLGIHNVSMAAPQIVATLVSSMIFGALQKPRGSVGDESVAWVLRFGGLAALVAAWLTRRVEEK